MTESHHGPRNVDELYELVDQIAARLIRADWSDWAERLHVSLSGSMWGEIFSDLGNGLEQLSKSAAATSAGVKADVELALDYVDASLRRVGQFPPPRK